jgi:hypothetical protein
MRSADNGEAPDLPSAGQQNVYGPLRIRVQPDNLLLSGPCLLNFERDREAVRKAIVVFEWSRQNGLQFM